MYLSTTIRRHLQRSLQSRKFLVLLILYVYILKIWPKIVRLVLFLFPLVGNIVHAISKMILLNKSICFYFLYNLAMVDYFSYCSCFSCRIWLIISYFYKRKQSRNALLLSIVSDFNIYILIIDRYYSLIPCYC